MSSILNFANSQRDIGEEFKLRLKLKQYEGVWFASILATLEWIEALAPIELRSEQMLFYKSVRYFAHHYAQIPSWPLAKALDPIKDYPPELVPTRLEIKSAIDWLQGNNRGQGRTYLIAVCLIELATANPEYEITLWDHHGGWDRAIISSTTRDIVWDVLHLQAEIVVNAKALIAKREGCNEINKRGIIGPKG